MFSQGVDKMHKLEMVTTSQLIKWGIPQDDALAIHVKLAVTFTTEIVHQNASQWTVGRLQGSGGDQELRSYIRMNLSTIKNLILSHQDEIGLRIENPPSDDDILSQIACNFIRHNSASSVPVSITHRVDGRATIELNYNERERKECPDLIYARIDHEFTHAIRYVFATHQRAEDEEQETEERQKKQKTGAPDSPPPTVRPKVPLTTPPRTVPQGERRYKLTKPELHSGYLIEHLKNGGVVVALDGELRLGENVVPANYVKVVSVDPPDVDGWERMDCYIFDEATRQFVDRNVYTFKGERITRHPED